MEARVLRRMDRPRDLPGNGGLCSQARNRGHVDGGGSAVAPLLDLTVLDLDTWMDASRRSKAGDHEGMTRRIVQVLA